MDEDDENEFEINTQSPYVNSKFNSITKKKSMDLDNTPNRSL